MSEWITPKTDWNINSKFNIDDYNRIKNNLVYLKDRANDLIIPFEIDDMGSDLTSYASFWDVRIFNLFETNLEKINQKTYNKNLGGTKTFYENGQFIKYDELNRMESSMITLKDTLDRQKQGLRHIPFRLGRFKEVRV